MTPDITTVRIEKRQNRAQILAFAFQESLEEGLFCRSPVVNEVVIGTCAHMDANEVGLSDTSGLDLIAGHAVWCHYQPDNDVLISDYVAESGIPVLAFSERSGLRVEGARMVPWGEEPAFRFSREGKARVRVGDLVLSAP